MGGRQLATFLGFSPILLRGSHVTFTLNKSPPYDHIPIQRASALTFPPIGGQNLSPKERSRDWIGVLMNSCFGYCDYHHDLRSNEMNVFCVDCALRMCRHCKEAHSLHRRFQIYKYSYQDVFRHAELQKYFDCSKIQTYISNNERIVHLKPRPSITKSKSADLSPDSKSKETGIATRPKSGGTCEECGKHLQDERNRFCSITCKISVHPVETQNQFQSQCSQNHQSARGIITPKPQGIDFTMNDNHNSEPESSISEAEPYGWVEVVNFRKRPRKSIPQRPVFVFTS
ncbi:hypothetical protein JHK82_020477 [Glycine max]|nr:hypothetical protein JHK85_020930 [Glycine max]KAG5024577.1 hypothetical protein JHK86_020491 [Glycine max]KAG5135746.1 hypothetical protein JHK82_020477 [Glycine max]